MGCPNLPCQKGISSFQVYLWRRWSLGWRVRYLVRIELAERHGGFLVSEFDRSLEVRLRWLSSWWCGFVAVVEKGRMSLCLACPSKSSQKFLLVKAPKVRAWH